MSTPYEEACRLIRSYVERGDDIKWLNDGQLGYTGAAADGAPVTATIRHWQITVQLRGETTRFPLKRIYADCLPTTPHQLPLF